MFINSYGYEMVGDDTDNTADAQKLAAKKARAAQRAAMAKRHAEQLKDEGAVPEEIKAAEENAEIQRQAAQELWGQVATQKTNWLILAALGVGTYFLFKG